MKNSGTTKVTIFDVAKRANVSYSTVSRVVNDYTHVKPATRAKVQAAMDELGYVANLKARSLAGGRSQIIGILTYDLDTNYNVEVVRGIDEEVSMRDYDIILSTTHHRRQKEASHVTKLAQGLVDGLLIVLPSNLQAYVATLQSQAIPVVLIDHEEMAYEGSGSIQATNHQGSYDATNHLLGLGHQRIGIVTGPCRATMAVSSAVARLAGYKAALMDANLDFDPELVYEGDFGFSSGRNGTDQMMSLSTPPTAIIAASDVTAFGAIEAVRDRGLEVPSDISIVGFDDIPEAAYRRPALTTVRQSLRDIGRLAAGMLIDHLEGTTDTLTRIELPTSLQIRDTTAPPRH